ncbi:MAG: peptidylprolyl isomerase [Bacteroidales bacterium]
MKKTFNYFAWVAIISVFVLPFSGHAQEKVVIDRVAAVVGDNAILQSELFEQRRQLETQGMDLGSNPECTVLEDMLFQKLLYNQAMIDSIEVSDSHVEQEIERRLRYFIQEIGSRERLEEYYGTSIEALREEFREPIREQEVSRRMEAIITEDVSVTPSEVRSFFNDLPEDSIPMVESEMRLSEIMIEPEIEEEQVNEIKARLENFRQRILDGESFRTLAIMYSEDPGSARRGGELGFHGRGELHPEFEAEAFSLEPGEISEIVETRSGYHIIELIERRGEQVNVRHLLLRPKVSPQVEQQTRNKLDSIRGLITSGEMTFAEAAREFSDHPNASSGGVMVNPLTGTTRFKTDELDPNMFYIIDRLDEGEISRPVETMTEDGRPAYQIISVRERIEPHPANLQQDYDFIQELALERKNQQAINEWAIRKLQSTYVSIKEEYRDCDFQVNWIR